jgi:hypothetical protein
MKRKKIYYNEEKNVDELKKKTPRGTCRHTGTSWLMAQHEMNNFCSSLSPYISLKNNYEIFLSFFFKIKFLSQSI